MMLVELSRADGPGEGECAWWEAWFDRLAGIGVRLEDCTGDLLRNLPGEEEDGSDEEGDEYEEGEEELLGVEVALERWVSSVSSGREAAGAHLSELRQLLEECRAMGEGREESVFGPMAAMFGGMGTRQHREEMLALSSMHVLNIPLARIFRYPLHMALPL
ncbi:hypothetical protein BD779DRAFT_1673719 [Infundibulicybe gibba]|nr:hypothetical protein BD779DRAFT_1673719 [Infundibulicybe gibba]